MPPYESQVRKYERPPEPGNPAQTEAWALLEAAKRLAMAIIDESSDAKAAKERRKAALRLNWRLWTIFQAELIEEKPGLPEEIRINMLTLCKFVDKHTVGALVNPTPEALTVLIDINRNIAAGLAKIPTGADQVSGDAAAANTTQTQQRTPPAPPQVGAIDTEV